MPAECLRFLERVSALYEVGVAPLRREDLLDIEKDSWRALQTFLAYAHERQGASPAYAPSARKAVQMLLDRGASWQDCGLARQAWQLYVGVLESKPPNERNNPMCPHGTHYRTINGTYMTRHRSVIEFVQADLGDTDYNIVRWAKKVLATARGTRDGHKKLTRINGIGGKLASFFLRDVAWFSSVTPDQARELLQPVDLWLRRYVHYWTHDDTLSDAKCASWIVGRSLAADVSPEKINAGMWYFGARVAGNERILLELIDDIETMRAAMDSHVTGMASQVAAWHSAVKDV